MQWTVAALAAGLALTSGLLATSISADLARGRALEAQCPGVSCVCMCCRARECWSRPLALSSDRSGDLSTISRLQWKARAR